MISRLPFLTVIAGVLTGSLSGCVYPPSINVIGAYFPDWLFCWIAGVLATLVFHALFSGLKVARFIPSPPLTYSLLTAFFSLSVWLLFFPS